MNLNLFCSILLPLMLANIVHMVFIKKDYLTYLRRPISVKLFGSNKTYRGFIVVGCFTALFVQLYQFTNLTYMHTDSVWDGMNYPSIVGFFLGIMYGLGELPNSYVKRRLGVPPGKTSQRFKYTFIMIDHLDSNIPCYLYIWLLSDVSAADITLFSMLTVFIHFSVNYILYLCGIRKNAL